MADGDGRWMLPVGTEVPETEREGLGLRGRGSREPIQSLGLTAGPQ